MASSSSTLRPADDPKEVHDHAQKNAEARERLSQAADDYLALKPTWGHVPTKEISEMELGHLRALGYAIP